jgi:hypothetical protein
MAVAAESADRSLKSTCEWYIRHVRAIGSLYVIVPTLGWFAVVFATVPLRHVYLLRLALSLVVGGIIGAHANRYGVALWLAKHRSSARGATLADGILVGTAVGFWCAAFPPLTSLILSSDLGQAKTFIIMSWGGAAILGGLVGLLLGSVGRRCATLGASAGEGESG